MSIQPWLADKIVKQQYPSRALDASRNEIRVLHLDPGQPGERIRCSLHTVSMDKYRWTEYRLKDYYHPLWIPDDKPGMTDSHAPHETTYAIDADYVEAEQQHRLPSRTCDSRARAWRTRDSEDSPLDYMLGDVTIDSVVAPCDCTFPDEKNPLNGHTTDRCPRKCAASVCGSTLLDLPTCGSVPCQCYEALSYTWGDFTMDRSIDLYGVPYNISDNLYTALVRLRKQDKTRRLWIDAICINQNDLAERAQQVRTIDRVYSQAAEVLVWLGDTDLLDADRDLPIANDDIDAKHAQLATYNKAVGHIVSRTTPMWWDRSWILQEVAKAHYMPQVQLGAVQISWSDLKQSQLQPKANLCSSRAEWTTVWTALEGIESIKRGGQASILDYHPFSGALDSLDSRDKVYSLLGMMTDKEAQLIEVDYTDTFSALVVFAQATYASMIGQGTLRALGFVQHSLSRLSHVPSWVIDFSNKTPRELGNTNPGTYQGRVWCNRRTNTEALVSCSGSVLAVHGLLFDVVQHVVPLTGAASKQHYSPRPSKKPRKPIDLIMSSQQGEFTLDQQAASRIAASLLELPSHDPYCLINAGDQCIDRCTNTLSWEALKSCAKQHLGRPAENAIISSRQDCLFAAWSRCLSLHTRDFADVETEREVLLGLNREEKAKDFSFFTTRCGFLGVGPRDTQQGDKVVLFYGSRLPSILREHGNGEFRFLGLGLVNGVSYGELCNVVPDIFLEEIVFHLR